MCNATSLFTKCSNSCFCLLPHPLQYILTQAWSTHRHLQAEQLGKNQLIGILLHGPLNMEFSIITIMLHQCLEWNPPSTICQ